jgi:hypothetical protein
MAIALGDEASAVAYRSLYLKGREGYVVSLWNGEYYRQFVNTDLWLETREPVSPATHPDSMVRDTEPRYQYGEGCLADQLLGQWFARVVGLGDLLPPDQLKSTLAAIFRHNFVPDLTTHETVQRVYALNDEAGLLLCTWPNGGRPQYPFPYADEVWTGIEYQVAAHCIYEGLIDEGLTIVRAVRDRHDGEKRNPWNEFECGHHYARAMASWSLILALSGYHYDAGKRLLGFDPKVEADDFQCFYSCGTAWGLFTQRRDFHGYYASIRVLWGEVTLEALTLPIIVNAVEVQVDGSDVVAEGYQGRVQLAEPVILLAGQLIELRC